MGDLQIIGILSSIIVLVVLYIKLGQDDGRGGLA